MTLKEELEILRGEPIEVFTGDPMDIPCIETSDPDKLCKHPVVSVSMITYNHEPYIRQALEGVMMQKTDFEFELVIGEDASTDKTREICFEYQKKYPDKIRVLWWHENVSKLGGNGRRCRARCRGEFIALCEGDDYWIDPLKLQKQVDVMRKYPSVGYCVTGAKVLCQIPKDHPRLKVFKIAKWYDDDTFDFDMGRYRPGFIPRAEFWENRRDFPRTATVMFRMRHFNMLLEKFEIFSWSMGVGDALLWMGFPAVSDAYYVLDQTAVYRLNVGGVGYSIFGSCKPNLAIELIEYYFHRAVFHVSTDALATLVTWVAKKRIIANERSGDWSIASLRKIIHMLETILCVRVSDNGMRAYFLLRKCRFHVRLRIVERVVAAVRRCFRYLCLK